MLGHNGAIGNLAGCMPGAGSQPPCLSCDTGGASQCPFVNLGKTDSLLECQERATAMLASALSGFSGAACCRTVTWCHPNLGNGYDNRCYCGTSVDAAWPPSLVQPGTDAARCLRFGAVEWGAPLLLFALLAGGIYVGAGVCARKGRGGRGLALDTHPHFRSWLGLVALARDGVAFAMSGGRLRGESGGSDQSNRLLPPNASKSSRYSSADDSPPKKSSIKSSNSKAKSPKHTQRGSTAGAAASESSAAPPPPATQKKAVPAGGGGSWVHVPA
jgi:hypothetical protein